MVKNSTFIGGSVTGSAVVTGDHSTITGRFDSTALPPAETVDIANALATFEQTITDLNLPDKGKVTREIAYMHEKAIEEEPDKQLIAAALESTSKYAKTAADFADNAKKIAEAGAPVVAWLGPVGAGLAKMLGLM